MTQHSYPVPEEGEYISLESGDDIDVTSTPSVLDSSSNTPANWVLIGTLIVLVTVFVVLVCYLTIPMLYEYYEKTIPVSKERLRRRYETIEGWLITKKVRQHCQLCETIQERRSSSSPTATSAKADLLKIKHASSYDTAETVLEQYDDDEDTEKECPVCMEEFHVDDIVSWSPSSANNCHHVFHHECIKEWLIHHDNCPYCRVTFLPVDKNNHNNNEAAESSSSAKRATPRAGWSAQELTAFAQERVQRQRTTYYCLEEGLVTLDAPPPSNSSAVKRFVGAGVQPGDLASLRGSRTAANNEDAEKKESDDHDDKEDDEDSITEDTITTNNTQTLSFSNAVVDIEMCLLQLRELPDADSES